MCWFQAIKRLNKPYLAFHVALLFNGYIDKIFPFIWQGAGMKCLILHNSTLVVCAC